MNNQQLIATTLSAIQQSVQDQYPANEKTISGAKFELVCNQAFIQTFNLVECKRTEMPPTLVDKIKASPKSRKTKFYRNLDTNVFYIAQPNGTQASPDAFLVKSNGYALAIEFKSACADTPALNQHSVDSKEIMIFHRGSTTTSTPSYVTLRHGTQVAKEGMRQAAERAHEAIKKYQLEHPEIFVFGHEFVFNYAKRNYFQQGHRPFRNDPSLEKAALDLIGEDMK